MVRRALRGLTVVALIGTGIAAGASSAGAADIFQVEFRHCSTLHVGFTGFPAQTVVRWQVEQHGIAVATGQFVAGAGGRNHFLNERLPAALDKRASASVTFAAAVDGREFRATAVRAAVDPNKPACSRSPDGRLGGQSTGVTPTRVDPVRLTGSRASTGVRRAATPARGAKTLAFTGERPTSWIGFTLLLTGGTFLLLVRREPRRALASRRRPAPWLCITPANARGR